MDGLHAFMVALVVVRNWSLEIILNTGYICCVSLHDVVLITSIPLLIYGTETTAIYSHVVIFGPISAALSHVMNLSFNEC